jgi:hypothetical protein
LGLKSFFSFEAPERELEIQKFWKNPSFTLLGRCKGEKGLKIKSSNSHFKKMLEGRKTR